MYLNCHTYYSFKFGTMSPEELLREAQSKGVRKLALTDINNTSAILDFHRLAKKYAIQPVAGIDFRASRSRRKEELLSYGASALQKGNAGEGFIGIAKSHHGFFELNQFLSKCLNEGEEGLTGRGAKVPDRAPHFEDAFVIYPFASLRETKGSLEGKRDEATCSIGEIASSRPHTNPRIFLAMTQASELRENEFIGIRPSDLNRLHFSEWKYHPDKLVALAPVTFRNKTDFNAHRLLRAMDNNIVLSKLPLSEQGAPDEIMMSEEELMRLYKDFPHIIYNTKKLVDECGVINFEFDQNKNKRFYTGNLQEDRELLRKLCDEGMRYRYPESGEVIEKRFEKEIDLITRKEFTSYFLINWDIVNYARSQNYFYVGRGSGANSMVAYLLRITDVDPIELDLYFERFINPSRKNPPDFDIDFSSGDRDDVIDYIFYRSPYGKNFKDHIALLATYSEMKDNSVTRELGKVFGLPKAEIDALLDNRNHPGTPDHITRLIHQYGRHLYSFPSHLSIHAGGILISEKPIAYYTALSNPPKGFPLTQFSMQEAEDVGFAKFDILSQRGLGKVREAVDLIHLNQNTAIDIHDVKRFMADKKVSENLEHAKLMGCFYVESPAMRMLLTKLEATTYLDLVAASSIIRPGVAQSGMMQEYIKRFHMPDHGKNIAIRELWDIMPETFGVMVYQEDVIKVAYEFGGFSLEEADKLRRGMGGKYRGRQEFLDVKDKFFSNCREKGKDEKLVSEVWFQMETFGGYAFAKGHSASYAVESYQCMFLKTYYPLEYMVAVINNGGGFFRTEYYIHEARMCGASIHAPHINKSDLLTAINGKDIYLGLNLINDLEKNLQQEVTEERKRNGPFSSLENFMRRVSVSVDQLRILIRIGAFRFTGRTKKQLLWDIHSILGHQKKSIARKELFEGENKKYSLPELFSDDFEDARDEIEILGFPLCSPFELIKQPLPSNLVAADLKNHKNKVIEMVGYYVTRKPTSTKKGEPMMFGCFLDRDGHFFDTNHFPEATRNFPFRGAGCYLVKGKVAEEFKFYSINVLEMHKIDYVMYEDDAETKARSKPDPVIVPPVVPASRENEYLLVISPPPHIYREVEGLKKLFHRQFDHYQAVVSRPHITLCNFLESEAKEPELIKQIAVVAGNHSPFPLSLENFDQFPPHTIYISVVNPDPVIDMVCELKDRMKLPSKDSKFIMKPHLTIARGLGKEKFSRASAEFCERQYRATFIAGSMLLLKKEAGEKFAKYETVREFKLEGKASMMKKNNRRGAEAQRGKIVT